MFFQRILLNSGIATEVYSLINNEEVRPTANLVVSKCDAYDYLEQSKPNLEKMTTQYYETFSITGRFTGYFSHITIGDFFNNLSSKFCEPTATLGGLNKSSPTSNSSQSSSESSNEGSNESLNKNSSEGSGESSNKGSTESSGESSKEENNESSEEKNFVTNPEELTAGSSSVTGNRGTENFGIAVFDNDVLCGELTAVEAMCHLLIINKLDSCIISVDNPISKEESEKTELLIFPLKDTKVSVSIEDDTPHISLELFLEADIMTLDKEINYETAEVVEKFSNSTKQYLEEQINNYLNKISKEYDADIAHFSNKATAYFSTMSEWENFNWKEKFKDAIFDIKINTEVLSTLLITKT